MAINPYDTYTVISMTFGPNAEELGPTVFNNVASGSAIKKVTGLSDAGILVKVHDSDGNEYRVMIKSDARLKTLDTIPANTLVTGSIVC